jgi:hypothetical protein
LNGNIAKASYFHDEARRTILSENVLVAEASEDSGAYETSRDGPLWSNSAALRAGTYPIVEADEMVMGSLWDIFRGITETYPNFGNYPVDVPNYQS